HVVTRAPRLPVFGFQAVRRDALGRVFGVVAGPFQELHRRLIGRRDGLLCRADFDNDLSWRCQLHTARRTFDAVQLTGTVPDVPAEFDAFFNRNPAGIERGRREPAIASRVTARVARPNPHGGEDARLERQQDLTGVRYGGIAGLFHVAP